MALSTVRSKYMSFFSTAISRYYQTNRWRIMFSNGMNLNQLSLETEERLGYVFGSSQCSRILRGLQIPTQKELDSLCDILNISEGEREQLHRAIAKDCLLKHSLYTHIVHKKHRYTKFLEYVLPFRPRVIKLSDSKALTELIFPVSIISLLQVRLAKQYKQYSYAMTGILVNPNSNREQWFLVTHPSSWKMNY